MIIEELLTKHELQINEVLRINGIITPGLDGIREGYKLYGDLFMMKIINVLKDENHFQNFSPVETPDGIFQGSVQIAPSSETATNTGTSSGWTFWENLLTKVGQTGQTIGTFKANVAGTSTPTATSYTIGESKPNSIILYAAGAAVLAIVLILILRKK